MDIGSFGRKGSSASCFCKSKSRSLDCAGFSIREKVIDLLLNISLSKELFQVFISLSQDQSQIRMTDAGFFVLAETEKLSEIYHVGSQIGQPGQFGVARVVRRKSDDQEFAVKIISKSRFFLQKHNRPRYIAALRSEIEILRKLDHPNIIRLHQVLEDSKNLYLIMDLCRGGELFERIQERGSYSEKDASIVVAQMLEAIRYMHENRIAHCDLKPDNFLFESSDESSALKVIDFGMSKHVQRRKYHRQICGTPYYIAPEVIDGRYNESCDLWSVGVVMFVMLFGFPPFYADPNRYGSLADDMIYKSIRKGFTPETKPGYGSFFPKDVPCSDSAKDLIGKLLKIDIADRFSAEEALDHPWVRGDTASSNELPKSVYHSFRNFNNKNKFKNAILMAMVNRLNDDQIEAVKTAFQAIDKDGDGNITAEELKQCFRDLSDEEILLILRNADFNGNGQISYEELLMLTLQRKIASKEERLIQVFRSIDKNGDGRLSPDELKEALGSYGTEMTSILKAADINSDGFIDYEEFVIAWGDYECNILKSRAPDFPDSPDNQFRSKDL